MWNNLRARHYSVLVLLALVVLETSAILLDRFIFAESEEAFAIESSFQNNSFIQSFRMADASCSVLPIRINDYAAVQTNKSSTSAKYDAPSNLVSIEEVLESSSENDEIDGESTLKSVSAGFVAAAKIDDDYSNYVEYSVQPGDSLSNIAELFGSKTEAIKNMNKLENGNSIKAGQTIKVPMNSDSMKYTVKKGDSLSKIASRFNISLESLVNSNNLKSHVLMTDQKINIPVSSCSGQKLARVGADGKISRSQSLPLVRNNYKKVADPTKLQLVKRDGNLPIASSLSTAKKADISFDDKELFSVPAQVAINSGEAEKESVELKINGSVGNTLALGNTNSSKKVSENETVGFVYKVAKGDNLSKIANRFNTTVAQIQADNKMNDDKLKLGQSLKISPNKKLYRVVKKSDAAKSKPAEEKTIVNHKVKAGESLSVLAKKYNTTISDIISENRMSNTVVMAGQTIKIPTVKNKNYKITKVSSKKAKSYSWKSPTKGWLSSPYGWRIHPIRKKRSFHSGIDLAAPKGTAIYCVAPGRVIYTGTRGGYGKLVIVSHANGLSTRYAHCSQILVKNGQYVKEGQLVGKVGATGVATGPHLHFEVRKNGKTQNPLKFLAK